jgi:catechol 2,3-dioxygenase-like lactoylglutathione lyase family enzyme
MSVPGLRGTEHVGLTVPDLAAAIGFFEDVLGCRRVMEGLTVDGSAPGMAAMLDVDPRAKARLAFLRCGNGSNLELFEYEAPDQATRPPRNSDVGAHHLCFYVDDMGAAVAYLRSRGVHVTGEPERVTEGAVGGDELGVFQGAVGPAAGAGELPGRQGVRARRGRGPALASRAPGAMMRSDGEVADVVIVGAGLSGAVAALRLAQAGLAVVCLEQGERPDPAEYPGDKPAFEVAAEGPWHPSPNMRRLPADYPVDDHAAEMRPLMFNGVGGSTILYGAHWMRFLPSDFRVRSLDGVADDWPLSYRDLAPYYDRVDADFGVSGVAGDPAYPDRAEYPMPPLPINAWGERVAAAHDRLGWHWWPGSNAIASRPYQGRRPCVQRGACGQGCGEGAKASVDRTHWPEAERLGVRLVTGARVARIETDRLGRATGVVWLDAEGREHRQGGAVVALAANAIGTPRLLLMSGLANRSGLVGRRLMMHPFSRVVGLFEEPMRSWQGHWGQSLYSLEFAETDTKRGFVRGASGT